MTFEELGIKHYKHSGQERVVCPKCPPLQKNGRPRTDKDLSLDHDEGIWNCFQCPWSGSLHEVKQQFTYVVPEKATTDKGKLYQYFEKRGISKSIVDEAGLEFKSGKDDWIIFNYYFQGQVINQKFRTPDKKFRQSKGGTQAFYRLDNIIGQKEFVITEGEVDALSFLEVDINATSVPGGGINPGEKVNKKLEFLKLCWDFLTPEKVYLALDNDVKGKGLRDELARRFGYHLCYIIKFPEGCKDANDVLVKYGPDKLRECYNSAEPYPVDGVVHWSSYRDEFLSTYFIEPEPYQSGMNDLDYKLKNLDKRLVLITGISGHGKSTFIETLLLKYAQKMGQCFGIYSAEHDHDEFKRHMIRKVLGHIPKKSELETVANIYDELSNHFIDIRPEKDNSLEHILQRVQYAVYKYGINGFLIDNFSNVQLNPKQLSETSYIGGQLSKITSFCKKYNVTCYLVAHPRKMEDKGYGYKKPNLYSVAGSAHFKNLIDVGLIIYRDKKENGEDITTLTIEKVKTDRVGETGIVNLLYNQSANSFEALQKGYEEFDERY